PRRDPLHGPVAAPLGRGGGGAGPHPLGRHRECAPPLRQRLHRQRDRQPRLPQAGAQAPHLPGRRLPGGRLRRAPRAHLPARARRLLLGAGEASGDPHGADLVRALRASVPDLEVFGVGGERLREAGMETVADVGQVATMGLKATGRLRALWHAYRTLARRLRADPPDLCVLIDFPEFNLRLARVAKRAGVPVLYYIGPQVWAWRRGRVRKIARRVDRLAVVFPFEPALYAPRLAEVEFVGHPLLDRVRVTRGRTETLAAHGLDPARRTVLLLPGSRLSEIDHLLPP